VTTDHRPPAGFPSRRGPVVAHHSRSPGYRHARGPPRDGSPTRWSRT